MPFILPTPPEPCPLPHRGPTGPNEDIGTCPRCWRPIGVRREAGETFGMHALDCSLPGDHLGDCLPGGTGHLPQTLRGPSLTSHLAWVTDAHRAHEAAHPGCTSCPLTQALTATVAVLRLHHPTLVRFCWTHGLQYNAPTCPCPITPELVCAACDPPQEAGTRRATPYPCPTVEALIP